MIRILPTILFVFTIAAAPVDRTIIAQSAMADAKDHLAESRTAEAVAVLEKALNFAEGDRAYLELLKSAYDREIERIEKESPDTARELKGKRALLGVSSKSPENDSLRRAALLFQEANEELQKHPGTEPRQFGLAALLFRAAFTSKVEMSSEQMTAWAYCRIRLANERLKKETTDPTVATEVQNEVAEALRAVPNNEGLKRIGEEVMASARSRGAPSEQKPKGKNDLLSHETENFVIKHGGSDALAESIARAAENKRTAIFSRWTSPNVTSWCPKCEIVLHADSKSFIAATQQGTSSTGRAVVQLDEGRVVHRRIDLKMDDETVLEDALPRELSTIIIADLFPFQPPPRWAEIGMTVLACSPTEVDRYRRTMNRCTRDGDLLPLESLLELKGPPEKRMTAYCVESVSFVEFLVKWKGEKAFKTFLGDLERYGTPAALKRQYGVSDVKKLQAQWLKRE